MWVKQVNTTKPEGAKHGAWSCKPLAGFLIPFQSTVSEARAQKSLSARLPAEFTAACYPYRLIFFHCNTTTTYHCLKLLSGAFVGITIPPSRVTLAAKIFHAQ